MARSFTAASSQHLYRSTGLVSDWTFTLACWFYANNVTTSDDLMSFSTSASGEPEIRLRARGLEIGDPVTFLVDIGTTPAVANTSSGYSANTWHHACGVAAGDTSHHVYLDGGSKVSDTSNTPTGSWSGINRFTIGAVLRNSIIGSPFDGLIAEAAVWYDPGGSNGALSDAEVAALAAGYSPLMIRPQYLYSYYPLIRDNDVDLISGLSMTASGGPTVSPHPPVTKVNGLYHLDYPEPTGPTLAIFNPHSGVPV